MILKQLLQKIALERREDNPFPEDLESYLQDFIPNSLLKNTSLQHAFGITNEEMELLYREGYLFYQERKLEDAATTFRFLVLFDSWIKKYWMGLASCQQLMQKYDKALHSYAIASLLDSDDPYPHFHAYQCYCFLNNSIDAGKALRLAYQRSVKPCHQGLRIKIEALQTKAFSTTCKM